MPRKCQNRNTILEELEIDGAEYIGSGKGYDVYKINTFNAAQQFIADDDLAGEVYTFDEATFNQSLIQDSWELYFIVTGGTNKVKYAIIKKDGDLEKFENRVKIFSPYQSSIGFDISCNFYVKDEKSESGIIKDIIPLYLIPGIKINETITGTPVIITNGYFYAVLGHLTRETSIEDLTLSDYSAYRCSRISSTAFYYGVTVNKLHINIPLKEYPERLFGVNEIIIDPSLLGDDFIYRVVGNEIHIVKGKRGREIIRIPAEIDGKPVTTIEAYAFSGNTDVRDIQIDATNLKRIERGAFYNVSQLYYSSKQNIKRLKNIPSIFIGKDALNTYGG